jgi:hypothetical protein
VEFHEVLCDSMRFRGIPQGSMRSYDVSVNQSVPTEANRGLISYTVIRYDSFQEGVGNCLNFQVG